MQLFSLGGLLVGMLVGTVVAVWAAKNNQKDLAFIGFSCCVFFGSIGGLILIIPIVAIFLWLIWKANNKSKQVSVNETNNTESDKFYDEVAREMQEKPLSAGLWAKAFAEMGGDDAKARALYIKYRVAQLAEASWQQFEKDRLENQQQEKPKCARIIKAFFAAVMVIGTVLALAHVVNKPTDFISLQKELAETGDANAANSLGFHYYRGIDVRMDKVEAYKWYSIAMALGNEKARENLTNIESDMTPEQIAKAKQLSAAFAQEKKTAR